MVTELTARKSLLSNSCTFILAHTSLSGTAAGGRYGVAKNATLIAVKILSDAGSVYPLKSPAGHH
jgi:hypothetical protein